MLKNLNSDFVYDIVCFLRDPIGSIKTLNDILKVYGEMSGYK